MSVKYCVLDENKLCDECGQCRMCDLDPTKVCDNCMKCIGLSNDSEKADYAEIAIDAVYEDSETPDEEDDFGTGEGLDVAGSK